MKVQGATLHMPCVDYRHTAERGEQAAYKNTAFKRSAHSALCNMDVHPVTRVHSHSLAVTVKLFSWQVCIMCKCLHISLLRSGRPDNF